MSTSTDQAARDIEQETKAAIELVNAFSHSLASIGLDVHAAATGIRQVAKEFEQQESRLQ